MSDDLSPLDAYASGLIASLEPAARRQLARQVARLLKSSQSKRISLQQNPDGTDFEPRKAQLRHQKGKIRRTMFAKLRTDRYLKSESNADAAMVRFAQAVERIAQVHQKGLRDKVNRKTGLEVTYPARRLLGITEQDEALIAELVTEHLANRL